MIRHIIFHRKVPAFSRRFTTSQASIVYQPDFHGNAEAFVADIDHLCVMSELSKSRNFTIWDTRILQAHFTRTGILHSDLFIANSLTDWYYKLSAVDDAVQMFEEIPEPNVLSWNIMISGHKENDLFDGSWSYFCRMHSIGFDLNQYTYGSLLSACSALGSVLYGKLVYSLSIKNGFFSDGYVRAGLIDLFAKAYAPEDSLRVFYDFPLDDNVVCWNTTISGAVKCGDHWTALDLFCRMRARSLVPNCFTFASALTACVALGELDFGKKIHGLVLKHGARSHDVFVGSSITDLYAKCGDMQNAVKEFWRMPSRNVVSWTTLISSFVQKEEFVSAFHFFREMRTLGNEVNKYTLTSILSACTMLALPEMATQIHSLILKSGFIFYSAVRASLINTYSKIGKVKLSEKVFLEKETKKDATLWAAMISGFAQDRDSEKAIKMFQRMLQENIWPNQFSVSSVLSIIDCPDLGRQVHSYMIKTGLVHYVSVGSSLFTMYSRCWNLEESYRIFEQIPDKDVVSWISMISGFSEHGYAGKAISLFRQMLSEGIRPDPKALVAILIAASAHGILSTGKEIHGYALRAGSGTGTMIDGALVNMYSKCGSLNLAKRVFDLIAHKDPISCSSLASGYAQNGYTEEALHLLRELMMINVEVDWYTISSVLAAVAMQNKTSTEIQLHAFVTKLGLCSESSVGSSLITIYSRLGSIGDCCKAFGQIRDPDLIVWTTMIMSYAQNGKGADALRLYWLMKDKGIKPDSITFLAILTACCHNGMVDEGYFHLRSMSKDYGLKPGLQHYACMVDLLGRSGRLKEAGKFINRMPIEPDASIWGTLLAACKVHGDFELGNLAAKKVFELEPSSAGAYISLSNMWAEVGQWEKVIGIRTLMDKSGVNKDPGWSSV